MARALLRQMTGRLDATIAKEILMGHAATQSDCNPMNSLLVAKVIERYKRDFGNRVLRHLEDHVREEGLTDIGWDDIHAAVGKAYVDFYNSPKPNPATIRLSTAAIEEGRTKPIQEVINGLRGRDT